MFGIEKLKDLKPKNMSSIFIEFKFILPPQETQYAGKHQYLV